MLNSRPKGRLFSIALRIRGLENDAMLEHFPAWPDNIFSETLAETGEKLAC